MKKIVSILCFTILGAISVKACPVCERNQPKILKGVVHGSGPDSQWDYIIITAISLIVLITLYLSVKWLLYPGEKSVTHIKRTVINL